jgi:hypothetical protein
MVQRAWISYSIPIDVLPSMRALIGDHAAESFPPVIEAIENERPVPQHVQRWIAEQLVGAGTRYQLRAQAKSAKLKPTQKIQRLEDIAASSTKLLKLLGIEDAAKRSPSKDAEMRLQ